MCKIFQSPAAIAGYNDEGPHPHHELSNKQMDTFIDHLLLNKLQADEPSMKIKDLVRTEIISCLLINLNNYLVLILVERNVRVP